MISIHADMPKDCQVCRFACDTCTLNGRIIGDCDMPNWCPLKEIIQCKDCKQWDEEGGYMGRGWCGYQMKCTGPTYFCASGEKEEMPPEQYES